MVTASGYDALVVQQISRSRISVQINVVDLESSIHSVLLGVGTTPGGYQLRPLRPIAEGHHGVLHVGATHGANVYVTSVATNRAGLSALFKSKPITIDHTPPEVTSLIILSQHIHNDSHSISLDVGYYVVDTESQVKKCFVGIGSAPYTTDLQSWIESTDHAHFTSSTFHVTHGLSVSASVRCTNVVELSTQNSSAPIVISIGHPDTRSARVDILTPDTVSGVVWARPVQGITSNLTVTWTGFSDPSGLDHYTCRVLNHDGAVLNTWSRSGAIDYAILPQSHLLDGHEYTVEVTATNSGHVISDAVNASVLVESRPPRLTGTYPTARRNGSSLTLAWSGVFDAPSGVAMSYFLSLGSREGHTDLVSHAHIDGEEFVCDVGIDIRAVYLVLKGMLPTGRFSTLNTLIAF